MKIERMRELILKSMTELDNTRNQLDIYHIFEDDKLNDLWIDSMTFIGKARNNLCELRYKLQKLEKEQT